MTVKLFALRNDPDTEKAVGVLRKAKIQIQLIDVEKEGILASLERDLDVRELPFLLLQNGKIEGLKAIEVFASRAA